VRATHLQPGSKESAPTDIHLRDQLDDELNLDGKEDAEQSIQNRLLRIAGESHPQDEEDRVQDRQGI
jgi:hypothetical protein